MLRCHDKRSKPKRIVEEVDVNREILRYIINIPNFGLDCFVIITAFDSDIIEYLG